ncbi:SH3 domain-containing protein [Defluviicoccus vanus]|uniref:SH3 domain-containing protein n=1 Tax=Defluviicoccus vanus TaxID=111831 RepID=A0A7H1N1G0_9PROT|nr:hypothetical protein [Defluviicoccus vanus]QNT69546.1 hypothetical protein HQ394_09660 [Defluviicoccus vanus]
MTRTSHVVLTAVALGLGGCQTVDRTVGSLLGEPTVVRPSETQPGQRFLTANDQVAVHTEPNEASPIVGFLRLKEPVTRTGLDSGYAYVSARDGDLDGWVDNALLTTRLYVPTAARPSTAPSHPRPPAPAANETVPAAKEATTAPAPPSVSDPAREEETPENATAATEAAASPPRPQLTEVAAETEPSAASLPAAGEHAAEPQAEMLNPF